MNEAIIQQSEALKPRLDALQRNALIIGVIGVVGTVIGFFVSPEQFYRSYLLGFVYWAGLSMGCLCVLLLHHLAGGRWGYSIRRLLEAGTRTIPLIAILLVPVLFGLHHLYEWTHADVVADDHVLHHKQIYLNVPFFIGRMVFYFVIWGGMAYLLNKWSALQDNITETYPTRRMQRLSGPGIVLFCLTMTFAGVDWLMSLEPHWFSTIFSAIYIIGQILLTWAFMILVSVFLSRHQPLDRLLTNERLRDLGTLMLGFVLLWAYTSFSQMLIIWAGNLPEEITWYYTRLKGGWLTVGYLLLFFHFALPFVLLVSSRIKARLAVLKTIAGGLIIMRLVDLYWITAPAFHQGEHGAETALGIPHWLDIVIPLGMGGIWVALFFRHLKSRSLIALNDPRFADHLKEASEGGGHHG